MMNYGLLANQGRREDNAQLGGQVAHISQQDAQILRALGGAGTTNPATGLPEYFNAGLAGGQGFGPGGASGHSAAGVGGTAASFGAFGQGTGGTASGVTGVGPGSSGVGSGLAGASLGLGDGDGGDGLSKAQQSKLFNWNLAPEGPQSVTSKTMTALQAKAKAKGGWGDQTMNAIFNLVSKVSPTIMAIKAIKGLLGEGGEGGGDGQTQTQTQTAAPPSISPTYAPLTGSIQAQAPLPQPYVATPAPLPAASTEPFTGTWWDNFYDFYGEDTALV